jgi:hypothetical protein
MATKNYARDEMLIELIRKYPALYQVNGKSYKDSRTVKENCFKKVAEEMLASGFDCNG